MNTKIGRNNPCPCGSGKKYKNCCLHKSERFSWSQKLLMAFLALVLITGSVAAVVQWQSHEFDGSGRVWSEEHQHWHPAP
jgi:uncharacterized iron-regulated membrane protein